MEGQEEAVAEVQEALVDMELLEAVLNHITSSSVEVPREVLALLCAVLFGGNEKVQNRFMDIWLASREEPFFASIKARMSQTEETLRERRVMMSQNRRMKAKKGEAESEERRLPEKSDPQDVYELLEMGAEVAKEEEKRKHSGLTGVFRRFFTKHGKNLLSHRPSLKLTRSRSALDISGRKPSYFHRHDVHGAQFHPSDRKSGGGGGLFGDIESQLLKGAFQDTVQAFSLEIVKDMAIKSVEKVIEKDMSEQSEIAFKVRALHRT